MTKGDTMEKQMAHQIHGHSPLHLKINHFM
nr:MAG TPA: hypothetical protein [Caudoviricetes sp.]